MTPLGVRALGTAVAVLLLGCSDETGDPERAETEQTHAIMREIFGGLRVALPAAADSDEFADPARVAAIGTALDALARNAALLERHSRRKDAQMKFLARSVSRDAAEVQRAYSEGRFDRSAYLLLRVSENCVVCHTRLPSADDSPLTAGFVDNEVLAELPLEPRANLQMATRRFDGALATLEELIVSSDEYPATMIGPLTDYLVINIRVKQKHERALPILRRFAERPDLWTQLRLDVNEWVEALPELSRRAAGEPSLEVARAMIAQGHERNAFSEGNAGLVYLVVASSVLQRLIVGEGLSDRDLGEAHYLLGLVEARIGRNYWVTAAPFLLETAIRLAPDQPFAEQAYALLEAETLGSYEGSDIEELPPEDARRLKELERILADARSRAQRSK